MKCINEECQQEIGEMRFCPFCGTKQQTLKVFCGYCGAEMNADDIFCNNCGNKNVIIDIQDKEKQKEILLKKQEEEILKAKEEERLKEERDRQFLQRLKSDWTVFDSIPSLAFKMMDGPVKSLMVKVADKSKIQRELTIPSSITILNVTYKVTHLDESAFFRCPQLSQVVLPRELKEIPKQAFKNCTNLRNVNIPDTVTRIGEEAFVGCAISSITIPQSVQFIDYDAFCNCHNLSKVVVKRSKLMIKNTTFNYTPFVNSLEYKGYINSGTIGIDKRSEPNLDRLDDDNHYVTRDYPYLLFTFQENNETFIVSKREGWILPATLVIPASASIGYYGYPVVNVLRFESSDTLERLVINSNNKINIFDNAFANCTALESVEINSLELMIFRHAFDNCINLKTIDFSAAKPRFSVTAFSGCSGLPMMTQLKLMKHKDARVDLVSWKNDIVSSIKR